jgi:hypothetical protein
LLDFTVSSPQRVFDYRADLQRGDWKQAEALVAVAFAQLAYEVIDRRDNHRLPDYLLRRDGVEYTVDVKRCSWIEDTGNFCFERYKVYDERPMVQLPSWGFDRNLDNVAVVGQSLAYARIVWMHALRDYIRDLQKWNIKGSRITWRELPARNVDTDGRDFTAHNWLIPVRELEEHALMDPQPLMLPKIERPR